MMLSAGIRQMIYRYPFIYRICKRVVKINNFIFWIFINHKYRYREKLGAFYNSCQGKRCFIIGNGPSLNVDDLEKIKKEDCFACNHIEKIFDKTSWRPKYYTVQDAYFADEINPSEYKKIFLSSYYLRKNKFDKRKCIGLNVKEKLGKDYPEFNEKVYNYIYDGGTVVYTNMQLAVFMGYSQIYLLGIDNDFMILVDDKGKTIHREGKNHFYDDSEHKERERNATNIKKLNNAYRTAKNYCDFHNIKIYNASKGGKLDIYEKIDLDTVLKGENFENFSTVIK